MSGSTPARLYCTLVGAALVIAGIIGFFYSASFATGAQEVGADADDMFGILAVNGWSNLIHLALGMVALALAGSPSGARGFSLGAGLLLMIVAIVGFLDSDGVLAGLVPVNDADNVLSLLLGLVGVAAGAATPTAVKTQTSRRNRPASA